MDINEKQFNGNEHWTKKWFRNIQNAEKGMDRIDPRRESSGSREWSKSSWFSPSPFPTDTLQSMDPIYADLGHEKYWDPSPRVRRFQKSIRRRPKDLETFEVSTKRPEFLHDMMKGTGAPEHVTVYHYGDIPKDAEYASGSVDPNWPEEVKSGWRSKDPSINRGRLHIYLVPHQNIIEAGGTEDEVFFRRGTPFNKNPRTKRQQMFTESVVEDVLMKGYEPERGPGGRFSGR